MYDAVADPAPHLYTIITARRPWPQRKSGKIKSAMLLMLLVCLFSKPRQTQTLIGNITLEKY